MRTVHVVTLLAVCIVLVITATIYVSSHNRLMFHEPLSGKVTNVGQECDDLSDRNLLTPEEMLAVRYAKGNVSKNTPAWTHYLSYLRAQMTKPPVPLADLGRIPHRRNLDNPNGIHYSQKGQSEIVDELLKGRRNGFFIECGAWNGEDLSNSLFFELHRNWTGLLIENEPKAYESILKKNRTVYTYHGCLSPTGRSGMLSFLPENIYTGIASFIPGFKVPNGTKLTPLFCVPLNDLLAALGIHHVDFLSLDIEGAEQDVLKNFDFNAVRVDVMSVEFATLRLQRIRDAVLPTGLYREAKVIGTLDVVFIRKDIV